MRIVISPHRSPLYPMVRVYAHGGEDMFYLQEVQDQVRLLSFGKYDPRWLAPYTKVDAVERRVRPPRRRDEAVRRQALPVLA